MSCGRQAPPPIAVTTTPSDAPRAIAFDPPLGATNVDPMRTSLAVTFDRAMDREGWAWVVENPATAPDLGESTWDAAVRVNTTRVRLEPGRAYVVWVNSPQFAYFRDPRGLQAAPVRWTFTTAGVASGAAGARPLVSAHAASGPPHVVAFDPPNGGADVDPRKIELRATFDRPMGDGWSWVTEGQETFPEGRGDAFLTADGLVAVLPVKLAPGRSYVVWLNSDRFRDFHDRNGVPLPPVRWTFTTAAH